MTRRKTWLSLLVLLGAAATGLLTWRAIFPGKPAGPDPDARLSREDRAIKAIETLGGKVDKGWTSLDDKPSVSIRLAGIKRLRAADLEPLKDILFIRELDLTGTPTTDADLEALLAMESLAGVRMLHLGGTKVTDAGVARLKGLMHLAWLDLADTAVTGAAVRELSEVPMLFCLRLAGTKVSDAGLADLKAIKSLVSLDLSRTGITDAGADRLKTLTGLRELYLEKTGLTPAALDRLDDALPQTTISR